MTTWAFRTMIVTAVQAALARALAAGLSTAGEGMFIVGLSPTGTQPETHYISTGMIEDNFAPLLQNADALYEKCALFGVSKQECTDLVSSSDVSTDEPVDAMARLGLTTVAL